MDLRNVIQKRAAEAAPKDPRTTPHPYQPEAGNTRWRTCAICGRGANASIHKAQPKTSMATTVLPGLTIERYNETKSYVFVDGVRAGWVTKIDGGWRFYAPVYKPFEGELLAEDKTRRDAIAEGLSILSIRHLGKVFLYDAEKAEETVHFFERERLHGLWDKLTDLKYGL